MADPSAETLRELREAKEVAIPLGRREWKNRNSLPPGRHRSATMFAGSLSPHGEQSGSAISMRLPDP